MYPGHFLVQGGARGLGLALVDRLLAGHPDNRVIATTRDPDNALELAACAPAEIPDRLSIQALDITDESSIRAVREDAADRLGQLDGVITCAGVLHDTTRGMSPEKHLADIDPATLAYGFAVNASGPLLMIKHFHDLLARDNHPFIASLSARVGSISDNGYGGWYGYRASKAAQNQFTRTAAIELARRTRERVICVGLHPGTVDTSLSEPFQSHVPAAQLQTPETAAGHLLDVLARLTPQDSGYVFDWAGKRIEP